jgi:hypothetical protein
MLDSRTPSYPSRDRAPRLLCYVPDEYVPDEVWSTRWSWMLRPNIGHEQESGGKLCSASSLERNSTTPVTGLCTSMLCAPTEPASVLHLPVDCDPAMSRFKHRTSRKLSIVGVIQNCSRNPNPSPSRHTVWKNAIPS